MSSSSSACAGRSEGRKSDRSCAGVRINREKIQGYLDLLLQKGRSPETVHLYRAKLEALYAYLPSSGRLNQNSLREWREALLCRYSPGTVNTYLSAVNGLLAYLGRRDLQLTEQLEPERELSPELTRAEYLRLLQAAKVLGRERTYFLIKVFALTGLRVGELSQITAEAVVSGQLLLTRQGTRQAVPIPVCLQEELLCYIRRAGISSGPVFVTRNRKGLRRTQVTAEIRALCRDARVDMEKGNPRCLCKLYRTTLWDMEQSARRMAAQSYERMLETEQLSTGWEEDTAVQLSR